MLKPSSTMTLKQITDTLTNESVELHTELEIYTVTFTAIDYFQDFHKGCITFTLSVDATFPISDLTKKIELHADYPFTDLADTYHFTDVQIETLTRLWLNTVKTYLEAHANAARLLDMFEHLAKRL